MTPSSGLHQGCCISPHLFNLTGQIFANLFESNADVEGVVIHDLLNLLSQFADDTNLFLQANQQTLDAVIKTLNVAQKNLGLKTNYEKTSINRVGSVA